MLPLHCLNCVVEYVVVRDYETNYLDKFGSLWKGVLFDAISTRRFTLVPEQFQTGERWKIEANDVGLACVVPGESCVEFRLSHKSKGWQKINNTRLRSPRLRPASPKTQTPSHNTLSHLQALNTANSHFGRTSCIIHSIVTCILAIMTTYLHKQKKADLQELAKEANVSGYVFTTSCASALPAKSYAKLTDRTSQLRRPPQGGSRQCDRPETQEQPVSVREQPNLQRLLQARGITGKERARGVCFRTTS